MCAYVFRINNPLVGMFAWSPDIKGTQVFLVLPLKFFAVDSEKVPNCIAVGSGVIY